MSPSSLDAAAAAVRLRYPPVCRQGPPIPLGNHGGFSGCALWRIDGPTVPLCLRAWPAHETWPRLRFRHRLMLLARQHGLRFVPSLFRTLEGATAIEHAGRLWELTEWLPGRADFHARSSAGRLEAACIALAQLHLCWRSLAEQPALCPAVQRRLEFVADWQRLVQRGWHPLIVAGHTDPLFPLLERVWRCLPAALERVPLRLQRWTTTVHGLQPCLCDLWHDHLLFEGERLTGLLDYGAVKVDHVAVDLARMLGSLIGNDPAGWRLGLQVYRRLAPLDTDEEELARALDETGTILGTANWLRWLYEEKRPFPDRPAVLRRLTALVERLETTAS